MNKSMLCLLLPMLLLCACGSHPEQEILGKWRSVKVENKSKDEFFRLSRAMIDTMGVGHTDAENLEIYETANMDSARAALRAQFDSAYAAQKSIDTMSVFNFIGDGSVILTFPGMNEKGNWHIDKDGNLVIEETNASGQVKSMNVAIRLLHGDDMKLSFVQDAGTGSEDSSVVIFRRLKN